MQKIRSRIGLGIFAILFLALLHGSQAVAQDAVGLADSPWPMYQHDPRHTGRSPFRGPQGSVELLWSFPLRDCWNDTGGIAIDAKGNLILSVTSCLHKFDPISRRIIWSNLYWGSAGGTPLVDSDGNIYWGQRNYFSQVAPDGWTNWYYWLSDNSFFGSSANMGPDGNVYVVHDATWSFTPAGDLRWVIPYHDFAHTSPAIGWDGTIYAGLYGKDLCSFSPDYYTNWCLALPEFTQDNTPAIGDDGNIYILANGAEGDTTRKGALITVNPAGEVEWIFRTDEKRLDMEEYLAIAPDGTIIFYMQADGNINYLFAITPSGQLRWKLQIPDTPYAPSYATIHSPFTIDSEGNIYFCMSVRCYGASLDGEIFWEYEFPQVDSKLLVAMTQPILAADGLFYTVDNQLMLRAYADPDIYPVLRSTTRTLEYSVEPGSASFMASIPVTSTVAPISYTVSLFPSVPWVEVVNPDGLTPVEVNLLIKPELLAAGEYETTVRVMPSHQSGNWLEIPINLQVGLKENYLPLVLKDYKRPYNILYFSNYFYDSQLAVMEQFGENRRAVLSGLPKHLGAIKLSPDGQKVLIVNGSNMYIFAITTGETLLSFAGIGSINSPAWSPDNSRVVFTMYEASPGPGHEVYIMNIDGSGLTRLTYNDQQETNLMWSPTGDKIIMGYHWKITTIVMNPDGSGWTDLFPTGYINRPLCLSPNGRYLLTASNENGGPIWIWIYDFQTGIHKQLVPVGINGTSAFWSPDGSHIAYLDRNGIVIDIFVIHPDGTGRQDLTSTIALDNHSPAWSPDGQWLAFETGEDIYIVRFDGVGLRKLTTSVGGDRYPFFLPHGVP